MSDAYDAKREARAERAAEAADMLLDWIDEELLSDDGCDGLRSVLRALQDRAARVVAEETAKAKGSA